jgi:diguanylate cyclase (GGDEF)-like protein
MVESGPSGETPGTAGKHDLRSEGEPERDPSLWLRLWRERLQGDARLPEDEARLVVEAVAEDLRGGHPETLDRAGRAWARAHRSISAMVGRLSSLREALAAAGVADDPLRMHRAIDRVTTAATEEVLNRLEQASRTDALTGVGNRRAFDETLSATLSAAARQGHEVTVVAVDLDGLKRINDTEGHAAGDAALMALVRAFYVQLRDEDRVFRVGGDEFVILLPFTSVDAAELLMQRIQRGGAPAFTWGAAGYPVSGGDARRLVEAADHDLYRRRQQRRDVAVPVRRFPAPHRQGLRRVGSWAWVPAAAVVVASLVATLVTSSTPRAVVEAKGKGSQPVTKPAGGSPNGGGGGAGEAAGTSGAASGGGSAVPAVTVGYTSPGPAVGGPGGQGSPGSPSSPGSPGGPPAGNGGVLGVLEQSLSPVPLVGGSNGLLASVGQILTGPTTTTSTGAGPLSTASTSPSSSGPSGLLAVGGSGSVLSLLG